jgi:hypothetical protein
MLSPGFSLPRLIEKLLVFWALPVSRALSSRVGMSARSQINVIESIRAHQFWRVQWNLFLLSLSSFCFSVVVVFGAIAAGGDDDLRQMIA